MTEYKKYPCDWRMQPTSSSVETLCSYLKCASDNICRNSVACSDLALGLIKENFGTYVYEEKNVDKDNRE